MFLGSDRGQTQDAGPGGARQRHKVYVGDRTETPSEEAGDRRPEHQARHVSFRLTHIVHSFAFSISLLGYQLSRRTRINVNDFRVTVTSQISIIFLTKKSMLFSIAPIDKGSYFLYCCTANRCTYFEL